MDTTIPQTPARTPQATPSPLMLLAARTLTADGITPQHAWRWDPNWADPALRDDAMVSLVEALAHVQGVQSPLEVHLTATGCAAVLAASRGKCCTGIYCHCPSGCSCGCGGCGCRPWPSS